MTPAMIERAMREIVEPTMRGMAEIGAPFSGILYAGLMLTADGPKLIEYNVRFGDPECQVLMPRLKDDILVLMQAAADGQLGHMSVRWRDEAALTVVIAAKGYPANPEKGAPISGIGAAEADGAIVFQAGTSKRSEKPMRRWTGSAFRAASAAAISAGGQSSEITPRAMKTGRPAFA
jgi:phosphoribosylamine--glycine ligase